MTAEILLICIFWTGQDSYEISFSNSTVVGSIMGRKLIMIIITYQLRKRIQCTFKKYKNLKICVIILKYN